jgi:hypothetical protein
MTSNGACFPKPPEALAAVLAAVAAIAPPAGASSPCREGFASELTKIHPDIVYHEQACQEPLYKALVLEVDLGSPRISFVVNDQDDGRMTTSGFAERYGVFAAVNGGYRGDEGGFTVSSGRVWSGHGDTKVGTVLGMGEFDPDRGATRVEIRPPEEVLDAAPEWMVHAVTGRPLVLDDGEAVITHDHRYLNRHPRTAAGLSEDRATLYIVTVDGRQKDWSMGLSIEKLADLFRALGATRAVNLDGGGSTTMVVPSMGGRLNRTCARHGRDERPVLNHVGVHVGSFDWGWPQLPAFSPPNMWFVDGALEPVLSHLDIAF